MATSAPALAQLVAECEADGLTPQNSEKLAVELAKAFRVQQEEVGILRLEKDGLVFVHPLKLHNVGRIPLNSPAVAVRTVNSKKGEIINNFAHTGRTLHFVRVCVLSPLE